MFDAFKYFFKYNSIFYLLFLSYYLLEKLRTLHKWQYWYHTKNLNSFTSRFLISFYDMMITIPYISLHSTFGWNKRQMGHIYMYDIHINDYAQHTQTQRIQYIHYIFGGNYNFDWSRENSFIHTYILHTYTCPYTVPISKIYEFFHWKRLTQTPHHNQSARHISISVISRHEQSLRRRRSLNSPLKLVWRLRAGRLLINLCIRAPETLHNMSIFGTHYTMWIIGFICDYVHALNIVKNRFLWINSKSMLVVKEIQVVCHNLLNFVNKCCNNILHNKQQLISSQSIFYFNLQWCAYI